MKYLLFFALIANAGYAQKIAVKNKTQQPLSGVSVFLIAANHSLVGITDSLGFVQIDLQKNSNYVFHLLGFKDASYSTITLQNLPVVVLEELPQQLMKIDVRKTKYQRHLVANAPADVVFSAERNIKFEVQNVSQLTVVKPGFLKEFRLYADRSKKEPMRKLRLLVFENKDGQPGREVFAHRVAGSLRRGMFVFDLHQLGVFLDAGNYFIGYEAFSDLATFKLNKSAQLSINQPRQYPYTMLKGKSSEWPKMFTRFNLEKWMPVQYLKNGQKMYIDMGYELEMDVLN